MLVPQALVSAPTAPGPIFDPVEITVRFRENVPVSAGPHALEVAETALALLHLYRPDDDQRGLHRRADGAQGGEGAERRGV